MSTESESNAELCMEFPCHFPLKVMGTNSDTFEHDIVMIVRQYVPKLGEGNVSSKPSKTGKYLALTIAFTADSREQLDKLYSDLHAHPDVKMTL